MSGEANDDKARALRVCGGRPELCEVCRDLRAELERVYGHLERELAAKRATTQAALRSKPREKNRRRKVKR